MCVSTQLILFITFICIVIDGLRPSRSCLQRVYDDDEIIVEPTEPKPASFDDMTKDEVEGLLFPKYKEALSFGVEALKLSKVSDDNEDVAVGAAADEPPPGLGPQENQGFLGFPQFTKAKDEFSKKPLPFVIGTKQFQDDDYCGLRIAEEEEEGSLVYSLSQLI
jgi:hypothetical protein